MPKLKINDIENIASREKEKASQYKGMVMVCTGTACVSAGGFSVKDKMEEVVKAKGLDKDFLVVGTGCNGFCAMGPIAVIQPEGTFYQKIQPEDIEELVETHLVKGEKMERLLHKNPVSGAINEKIEDIDFFSKQQLIALRNKGLIDPENIDHYIARDGYKALKIAIENKNP
ncbi:MAG: NAD(P)H-dependent oxidoreductase subunit E, partial [Calditrichia bacterium]|nr:NAD(P)H-dependent oxidoreductase subunit E [Calditrichia bacterium]